MTQWEVAITIRKKEEDSTLFFNNQGKQLNAHLATLSSPKKEMFAAMIDYIENQGFSSTDLEREKAIT